MKRLICAVTTIGLGLGAAACGDSAGTTSSASKPTSSAATLQARQVSGVGRILDDASGDAVYANDQERNAASLCTGACTSFWKPVSASVARSPTASDGTRLGVVRRSDGTMQLASNGKPLYTFAEDAPGAVHGNDFSDQFGGHHFTWHVVRTGQASVGTAGSAGDTTGVGNSSQGRSYPSY